MVRKETARLWKVKYIAVPPKHNAVLPQFAPFWSPYTTILYHIYKQAPVFFLQTLLSSARKSHSDPEHKYAFRGCRLVCDNEHWLRVLGNRVLKKNIVIPGELPLRERCHFFFFLVRLGVAVHWRSQHMCLLSESREVLWVDLVNIGTVFWKIWWLILWG